MSEDLIEICQKTAKTYGRMLGRFRPCKPGSEYLEQNLITLFCHEFLNHYDDAIAFTELPFRGEGGQKWNARMDGYLVAGDTEYLLEAKSFYNRTNLFERIERDLQRIASAELEASLREMISGDGRDSFEFTRPSCKIGLVMANCWSDTVAEVWAARSPLSDGTGALYSQLNQLERHAIKIKSYESYEFRMLVGWTEVQRSQCP